MTKPIEGVGAHFVHRKQLKTDFFLKEQNKRGNFTLYITITVTNKIIIIMIKKIMFFFCDRTESECFLEMGLDGEKV